MQTLRHVLRSPWTAAILFSLAVCLIILLLRGAGYLEGLELKAYDGFTLARPGEPAPENHIAIIGIFEEDIRGIGQWPISDAVLADSLATLSRYDPLVIGLDLFRDIPVPPGKETLDAVLSGNRNIIGVMKFGQPGVPPPPSLAGTSRVGFNDVLVDKDGIVRRALLFLDDGREVFYSLPLRLSIRYLQATRGITPRPDEDNPEHIRLGGTTVKPFEPSDGSYVAADARGYQFLINDRKRDFPVFSLSRLLSGEVDPTSLKHKIVLIGVMAESVKDLFFAPQRGGFQRTGPVPGVLLHAGVVDQLLGFAVDGDAPMDSLEDWQENLLIVLLGLLGGMAGLWIRSAPLFFFGLSGGLFIWLVVSYVAFSLDLWIPALPPAMTWTLSLAVLTAYSVSREKRQRTVLMDIFTRHVSPDVAEDLWRKRDQFLEDGRPRSQELPVTVLFSDLKGYTTVSEALSPASLVHWLNVYLDAMSTVIMEHHGVVDDFLGDGIKANFGVPVARPTEEEVQRDAMNAAACALAMEAEMHRLNRGWRETGRPEAGMRVGICTGLAVAGTVGSSRRMKYTTIGDTVNTAARLEQFDKSLARESLCRILICESTLVCLGNAFFTEKIGAFHLKGKDKEVVVYRLHGWKRDERGSLSGKEERA